MNTYAQWETDKRILTEYFNENSNRERVMIEVGAGWPELWSQSKLFREMNWRVISFEPEPKLFNLHKKIGNEVYQYAIADHTIANQPFKIAYLNDDIDTTLPWTGFHPEVMKRQRQNGLASLETAIEKSFDIIVDYYTLDDILSKLNIETIDYLSIDVEGWELNVLKGCKFNKHKPKVILVENVLNDPAYHEYLNGFGYTLKDFIGNQDQLYVKS